MEYFVVLWSVVEIKQYSEWLRVELLTCLGLNHIQMFRVNLRPSDAWGYMSDFSPFPDDVVAYVPSML